MAVDDSKLSYSSNWDIDQLVASADVEMLIGTSTVYTITDALNPPTYKVQFKSSGDTKWYDCGVGSLNSAPSGLFTVYAYIDGTSLKVTSTNAGTVRYRIWDDGIIQ